MRQYLEEKVLTVYRQQMASAPGAPPNRSAGLERAAAAAAKGTQAEPGGGRGIRIRSGTAERHLGRNRWGCGQAVRRGALDPYSKVRILPRHMERPAKRTHAVSAARLSGASGGLATEGAGRRGRSEDA